MVDNVGTPRIRSLVCTRCGACVASCPVGALELGEDGPVLTLPALCGGCALCEEFCPEEAIECEFSIVW